MYQTKMHHCSKTYEREKQTSWSSKESRWVVWYLGTIVTKNTTPRSLVRIKLTTEPRRPLLRVCHVFRLVCNHPDFVGIIWISLAFLGFALSWSLCGQKSRWGTVQRLDTLCVLLYILHSCMVGGNAGEYHMVISSILTKGLGAAFFATGLDWVLENLGVVHHLPELLCLFYP